MVSTPVKVQTKKSGPRLSPKVFYLASGPVPSDAANSIHVAQMCAAIKDIGFEIAVVSPREKFLCRSSADEIAQYYGIKEGVRFSSLWSPKLRGGRWLYKSLLRAKLALGDPDYVYGRNLLGCVVAARLGLPTAFEAHMPVWERDQYYHDAFRALIDSPSFQAVVVISRALSKELLSTYPDLEGRVHVAHDAASYSERSPHFPLKRSEPFEVLYAGSLYAGKGMELLLEMATECPWARFRILGGNEEDIKKWVASVSEGICNIEFLGRKPHSLVRDYMTKADVLVAPYQSRVRVHGREVDVAQWMSPLKIFEYMAADRPIIASNLPVLREVLTHRRNALLASPDDAGAWVGALQELRNSPSLASSIASRARKEFENKYTWRSRAIHIMGSLGWYRVT